ncbi:unknown [Prevotella sp. CAG:255]|nr:unknown [Prevotella sp. CAG:255]
MSWDYLYREYIKNYRNFDLPGMIGIYYEFCS